MNKKQCSRETHASVFSKANRAFFCARIFLFAMFVAFSVAGAHPKACIKPAAQTAQESKHSLTIRQPRMSAANALTCEQALVLCLAGGGGPAKCGADYDACLAGGNGGMTGSGLRRGESTGRGGPSAGHSRTAGH